VARIDVVSGMARARTTMHLDLELADYAVEVLNRDGRCDAVSSAVERFGATGPLFRCQVTELEYLRGTAKHQFDQRRRALLAGYADLELTLTVLDRALEVQALLAAEGQHQGVKVPDLLIAACAETHGAAVLHYDADFDIIAEVTEQDVVWVVPRGTAD
jgi:hypothetical protein